MKAIRAAWLLLWTFAIVPLLDAADGKRVAFVVGIGTYDKLATDKQLRNAVNDAEGVSVKLTEIGFQVTKAPELTRSAFYEKWQNILNRLTKDDTFVLYFSGHGIQISGQNYLLPRDIPYIEYGRDEQLRREAISLNELLADLSTGDRPHPHSTVVILDACRDNPLIPPGYNKSAATVQGLAGLPEPDGIFVLYAAASNRTALDRLSSDDTAKYSVFTRTLLPLMGRPDLSIHDLSEEVKNQVWKLAKSVGREQRPTAYNGMVGRFCLPGCTTKAEKEPVGLKENLTTTVVRPSLPKEITDKVKLDSLPVTQSTEPTQQLAMKQPLQGKLIEKRSSRISGKDGAPMVLVPAGEFMMGSREDDQSVEKDELPGHSVQLDSYYIDQYEVTTARYAKFLQETNRPSPEYWSPQVPMQNGRKPVVGVEWNDASAYCTWAGKRLPTEAEWEKAARGTDERSYPWGNAEPNENLANFDHCCDFQDYAAPSNVGSFDGGKSPYGVHDMAGNVWEWVSDWYGENYYEKAPVSNPIGASDGEYRVLRGGSWSHEPVKVRSSYRLWLPPTERNDYVGFRCVQDAK